MIDQDMISYAFQYRSVQNSYINLKSSKCMLPVKRIPLFLDFLERVVITQITVYRYNQEFQAFHFFGRNDQLWSQQD